MTCVFADDSSPLSFSLVHQINIGSNYSFFFKDTSDDNVSSIVLSEGEANEDFVSLFMEHDSNVIIKGITVTASDLQTEDKSASYPYTMSVKDGNGNAIEWTQNAEGDGSGYAHIVSKTTVFRYKDTGGLIKFADFSIDLSTQDEVPYGTYSGTMTLYYSVI